MPDTARPDTQATGLIAATVRQHDRDRYWAALYAPPGAREHLLALYALDIELARIAGTVREPMAGQVRLQWWRDALEYTGAEASGNPVIDAIRRLRLELSIPVEPFVRMADARAFDFGDDLMPDVSSLHAYLADSAGSVFRIACRIVGAEPERAAKACDDAAMAYGLTALLRDLPYHSVRGKLYLPAAHLVRFDADPYALFRGEEQPGLKSALMALRVMAEAHLGSFRQEAASLPRETLPVFLPLALVEPTLRQLVHPSHRPLHEVRALNPGYRYYRMAVAHWRGRI